MGGIVTSTPAKTVAESTIIRSTQIRSTDLGHFGAIPPKTYRRPKGSGLKNVIVGPLELPKKEPDMLKFATYLDNMWLVSFSLLLSVESKSPNWSGFMQVVNGSNSAYDMSSIDILPFINLDPTKLDTIY